MKDYLFVKSQSSHEIIINRSRFIATVTGVENVDEANNFIQSISKKYGDATHNCYAYILSAEGSEQKFSDDGEPQGTAGLPMLEVIKKKSLYCTAVVVTRYFGGIKLGAGGLAGAYGRAVAEALDKADIKLNRFSDIIKIKCSYQHFSILEKRFKQMPYISILSTEFHGGVEIVAAVPECEYTEITAKIADLTLGEAEVEQINKQYYSYQI